MWILFLILLQSSNSNICRGSLRFLISSAFCHTDTVNTHCTAYYTISYLIRSNDSLNLDVKNLSKFSRYWQTNNMETCFLESRRFTRLNFTFGVPKMSGLQKHSQHMLSPKHSQLCFKSIRNLLVSPDNENHKEKGINKKERP